MSTIERPDFATLAQNLTPEYELLEKTARGQSRKIAGIRRALTIFEEDHKKTATELADIAARQNILRKLDDSVKTRKRVQQVTALFPLISAINATSLDMLYETDEPVLFAEAMKKNDMGWVSLSEDYSNPAQQIRTAHADGYTAPTAIIQITDYGITNMVLFTTGIEKETMPAVWITVADGSVAAHHVEFHRRESSERLILTQGQSLDPRGHGFYSSYQDMPEIGLQEFMGDNAYQDALVLMQPAPSLG